jgi:hypothetical protein
MTDSGHAFLLNKQFNISDSENVSFQPEISPGALDVNIESTQERENLLSSIKGMITLPKSHLVIVKLSVTDLAEHVIQ